MLTWVGAEVDVQHGRVGALNQDLAARVVPAVGRRGNAANGKSGVGSKTEQSHSRSYCLPMHSNKAAPAAGTNGSMSVHNWAAARKGKTVS